jgi:DNA-binding beta-propeller fold protein YncE
MNLLARVDKLSLDTNIVKIKDIAVEEGPISLAIDSDTNTIYVTNRDSASVSLISGENNTK